MYYIAKQIAEWAESYARFAFYADMSKNFLSINLERWKNFHEEFYGDPRIDNTEELLYRVIPSVRKIPEGVRRFMPIPMHGDSCFSLEAIRCCTSSELDEYVKELSKCYEQFLNEKVKSNRVVSI